MAKRKKVTKSFTMGYYLIAFVDLLGQQEQLRNLTKIPDKQNQEELENFFYTVRNSYGTLMAMEKIFRNYYEAYSKRPEFDTSTFDGNQKRIYMELNGNPIKIQSFSDSFVIYTSLSEKINKLPMRSIYGIICSLGITSLSLLANGHPIRCGVDIGLAMEVKNNNIYGPALSRAYTIESRIANYPRVVIGNELFSFLSMNASNTDEDVFSKSRKEISETCLKILDYDDDGHIILDYLGNEYGSIMKHDHFEELAKKSYKKIVEISLQLKSEQQSKIAFKYSLLRNYFNSSQPELINEVLKEIVAES